MISADQPPMWTVSVNARYGFEIVRTVSWVSARKKYAIEGSNRRRKNCFNKNKIIRLVDFQRSPKLTYLNSMFFPEIYPKIRTKIMKERGVVMDRGGNSPKKKTIEEALLIRLYVAQKRRISE